MKVNILTTLAAMASIASTSVAGLSVQPVRRQADCSSIGSYFKLVNTALFSVNYVQNYAHPCNTDLIPYFDAQGLDGVYALDLICLYNAGTQLFNESLDIVNDNLIITLIGLFDAASSNSDPSRNLSCAFIDTTILDAIYLDSAAIKRSICDFAPCTSSAVSSAVLSTSTSLPASQTISGGDGGSSGIMSSSSGINTSGSSNIISASTSGSSYIISTSPILSLASISASSVISTSETGSAALTSSIASASVSGSAVLTSSIASASMSGSAVLSSSAPSTLIPYTYYYM